MVDSAQPIDPDKAKARDKIWTPEKQRKDEGLGAALDPRRAGGRRQAGRQEEAAAGRALGSRELTTARLRGKEDGATGGITAVTLSPRQLAQRRRTRTCAARKRADSPPDPKCALL